MSGKRKIGEGAELEIALNAYGRWRKNEENELVSNFN
jgi:hypothetical protein